MIDLDKLEAVARAYNAAPDDGAYDVYHAFDYAFDSDTCLALIAELRDLQAYKESRCPNCPICDACWDKKPRRTKAKPTDPRTDSR